MPNRDDLLCAATNEIRELIHEPAEARSRRFSSIPYEHLFTADFTPAPESASTVSDWDDDEDACAEQTDTGCWRASRLIPCPPSIPVSRPPTRDPNTVMCNLCDEHNITQDGDTLSGGRRVQYPGGDIDNNGYFRSSPRRNITYIVCDECIKRRGVTSVCEGCGERFMNGGLIFIHDPESREDHWYCPTCAEAMHAYRCPICGNEYTGGEGDHPVCDDCRENAVTCEICGAMFHRNSAITLTDGRTVCGGCAYGTLNEINRVKDWNYRPPRFHLRSVPGEWNPALYMGVEVEMDMPMKRLRALSSTGRFAATANMSFKLHEMNQPVYFKHDGSLNCGFEIVSHPCTLKFHTGNVAWKKMFRASIKAGFRAHKTATCGLHVHVNRDFFGSSEIQQDLNIAKIILLVSKFWDSHVVNFSRRDYAALERYAKKPDMYFEQGDNDDSVVNKIRSKYSDCHDDRYYAVNIQNQDTVEFRMFRGTLNYSTFLACLQWVQVLCNYVKTLNVRNIYSVTWEQIFGGSPYEELNEYMKKRGLMA